jgi:hypothetical protein
MVWEGYGMYDNIQTNKTRLTLNMQMTDLKLVLVQTKIPTTPATKNQRKIVKELSRDKSMTKPQYSLLRQGAWVVIRNEQAYSQYSYIGF